MIRYFNLLSGHRGYGSTEADKLSFDRFQSLIPEEERRSNGHSKDHDAMEDVGRGSEPDSPSSPGWDQGPRSPILDLRSFQGVVEEGVLVNVTGSPGEGLEDLDCLDLEGCDDGDTDDEVNDEQPEELACLKRTHKELPESEQQEEKCCNEEELRHEESCDNELRQHEEENSSKSFSPELNNHNLNQILSDDEDPDHKSVSDAELSHLLKTISSSDEE